MQRKHRRENSAYSSNSLRRHYPDQVQGDLGLQFAPISAGNASSAPVFMSVDYYRPLPRLCQEPPGAHSTCLHRSAIWQPAQLGLRASQTARPCITRRWQKSLPSSGGTIFHRAISTRRGSLMPSTRPMRLTSRMQWVSVTMAGLPNTSPMIRLALLRPTPGSASRASKSSGTLPSYSSRRIRIQALMSRALLRPRPQGLTMASISSGVASARACTLGYLANSSSVTTFTLASVHWAASRTPTSSCQAFS